MDESYINTLWTENFFTDGIGEKTSNISRVCLYSIVGKTSLSYEIATILLRKSLKEP